MMIDLAQIYDPLHLFDFFHSSVTKRLLRSSLLPRRDDSSTNALGRKMAVVWPRAVALALLGCWLGSTLVAGHDAKQHGTVKPLASRDVAEKLDGKDAKATAVEVTLEPGQAGEPHRHPGPAFG